VVAAGAAVVEAAVAEVTVVAAEAAAVDEAAVAEVTVVDEAAAVVEAAAVAEATVVVGVTTVAGDPDSEMATAAAAMTQGRTTVARVVPLKDTEARHEAKPTSLQRIRRKASVTVKPIETTGHRKVASAVAEKETTEPKLILPQHSWLVAKRFHNLQ
jgi:carbonic anhydrase/acetyltransferase-like protein (isoleucine patch superfamily)